MSGPRSSKRFLKSTVAAAAAGAVVFAPMAPLAQEQASSGDPIEIRVGNSFIVLRRGEAARIEVSRRPADAD